MHEEVFFLEVARLPLLIEICHAPVQCSQTLLRRNHLKHRTSCLVNVLLFKSGLLRRTLLLLVLFIVSCENLNACLALIVLDAADVVHMTTFEDAARQHERRVKQSLLAVGAGVLLL